MKLNKYFKKIILVFLSVLIGISSMLSVFATTFAATKQEVYIIDLPRADDQSQNNWGHPAYEFMNGWSTFNADYVTVKAIDDYEGDSCYCIEPGVHLYTGNQLSKEAENFWDNYPSKYNKTISPDTIKIFLGRIMQYGYTGKNSLNWVSTNDAKADECANHLATQLLVWETVVGERDDYFNHVDATKSGKHNIKEMISSSHPLRSKIFNHYNRIEKSVLQHTTVPSFSSRSKSKVQTVELEWNGKSYSATINDSNGVLANYDFSGSNLSFSKSGNSLTITTDTPIKDNVQVTVSKKNGQRKAVVTWTDGVIGPQSGQLQDIITFGQSVTDPVTAYFDVKCKETQKGTIMIEKKGEVYSGVEVSGTEEGEIIYKPLYEVKGIGGATYEIRAAENIVTKDGQIQYQKGTLVDTITTESDGFVESKELYLGKYEVKEVKAPNGMVLNTEPHIVELKNDGQIVPVVETSTSFQNERQKAKVSFEKTIEKYNNFGIGDNDEIKEIRFGLYADKEIVSASGTSIPKDGLIEIVSVAENEQVSFKSDIPFGKYYVKEIKTDEHYILPDVKYPIVFEYAGQDISVVEIKVNDGKPIENHLICGTIKGKKIDENGKGLEGALIGVFKPEETEFTEETAILTTTSFEDGSFSFAKVPYGKWIVREIKQPKGLLLSDKSYEVDVCEDEQEINIEISNEHIHGNIKLTKVDAEYPDNKLSGAIFEVYQDTNENKILDDVDEFVDYLKETDKGIYEMNELVYGHYIVIETAAPEGFLLDNNNYPVFIEKDKTTYTVENEAGVGFINKAMRGSLKIVKTSSDGTVSGFSFRVTGPNGYDNTFETDENGEIFIGNLRIGEYKVSEVSNSASALYITPDDQTVTVCVDEIAVVNMHNQLRDNPNTGYDINNKYLYILLGVSAIGVVVTTVLARRKNKKEEQE